MRILLIGVLLALSGFVQAEVTDCELLAEAAQVSMSARQDGIPLARLVDVAPPGSPTHLILIGAWDEPLWPHESYKRQAINEYESKVYLACLRRE